MPKHIRIIETELRNFTNHRDRKVKFGNITRLSGKNGQGKTSIGTAPVWVLYGTDLYGSKFNPTPLNYEFDRVFASVLLEVDGKQVKFAREIENGKNAFYINDVPTKAKEYEAAVAGLFDKDEFLSLYNPQYFFGLHWTKQREMILRYTLPPAKSEVLQQLPRLHAEKLDELTKKHSLDDLQKLHRDQKTKLEKAHIAAQSRTKTLREQLERLDGETIGLDVTKAEITEIEAKITEIDKVTDSAGENNAKINGLNVQIRNLIEKRDEMKRRFPALQNEPIADTCRVCKQPLQGDAVKAAEEEKQKRITDFKAEYDQLILQRKELEEELSKLEYIDVSEQIEKVKALLEKRDSLRKAISDQDERERLASEVEKAKADEADTLAGLKESIFILDAIKAYRAKEAELQAAKVQSLFTTLSIRLFKYVKTTDEWEPDFSIQMDGKDYAVLSAGEKIAASLELTEVLFKQSELIVPCFIDGIESYTGKVAVYDQLITGRAVPDQELKIETED